MIYYETKHALHYNFLVKFANPDTHQLLRKDVNKLALFASKQMEI